MHNAVKKAIEIKERLDKTANHVLAVKLAFDLVRLLPELVDYLQKMETSVTTNKRHLVCRCEVCNKQFKVYHSQMASGRKSGRFCSMACFKTSQKPASTNLGGPITIKCEWCGDEFTHQPAGGATPKFCSSKCEEESYESDEDEAAEKMLSVFDGSGLKQ